MKTKTKSKNRFAAVFLALAMLLTLIPVSDYVTVRAGAAETVYILDAGSITAGDYKGADDTKAGTNDFFTIKWGDKGKVDASSKTFDDGVTVENRINFDGKTDVSTETRVIEFKTEGAAKVKVWWVCGGDGRKMHVYSPANSADVAASEDDSVKNSTYISTFDITEAGTYWLASTEGNNWIFKVVVTEGGSSAPVVRGDWNDVAVPVIDDITQNGGKIVVSVTADVGNNGGDKVVITMKDSEGNETSMQSLANATTHTREFTPTASGTYRFKAVLSREGEDDKESSDSTFDFVLPLGKPTISATTNKGAGSVELEWTPVAEAEKYNIYNGTELAGTSDTTKYTVTGLEIGKQYSFTVAAVRGDEEGGKSDERTITVSAESQSKWSSIFYGTSTGASKNYVVGDLNEDGKVQVVGNGGKIVPAENYDGVTFYYTEIPDSLNFTLKAKVHIDDIDCSDGQTGFGLLAIDSLPVKPNSTDINPTNQYMLAVSKMEYRWDDGKITYDSAVGEKYTMKHGIGVNERLLDDPEDTGNANKLHTQQYPLETSAAENNFGCRHI